MAGVAVCGEELPKIREGAYLLRGRSLDWSVNRIALNFRRLKLNPMAVSQQCR
jgi:hypothetical protein